MSTRQVERLEALLALVQRNRVAQRGDNGVERVQHAPGGIAPALRGGATSDAVARKTPIELAAPVAAPVAAPPPPPPQPAASAPAQPARARPAPTPLEMALEGRASGGIGGGIGQPGRAAPAAPAAPQPPPSEGRVLAEPNTTEPTKPIVQVVSKQPPVAAASFGELLKRSLSLRPR